MKTTNSQTVQHLFFVTIGALLSWAAWPPLPFFPLIFFAWVPLLLVEHRISEIGIKTKRHVFLNAYVFFFIWNATTTWWVKNASFGGAIAAVIFNSLFMCAPILLFHLTKKRLGAKVGYFSFFAYWLSFEYGHQVWEISWPWLTLGNVFAEVTPLIQWYEYTGSSGGTFWVLLMNYFIFQSILKLSTSGEMLESKQNLPQLLSFLLKMNGKTILTFFVPIAVSVFIYNTYEEKGEAVDIVVLQPNIDPYEKFDRSKKREQTQKFIDLSVSLLDEKVDYLVWPETSLPEAVWAHRFESNYPIQEVRKMLGNYPDLTVVTGVTSLRKYTEKETATARPYRGSEGGYYDVFNAAIELNGKDFEYEHYIKSKLVPGVERMPYPSFFGFLEYFSIDLGGIAGSMGMQSERDVFTNENGIKIAPVICYESVYAEYVTEYIRKGAHFIFIVTNDAWWGFTPGHKQHLKYACLRAIENRRSIARSANTGISCFINQRGDILQPTKYNEDAVIRGEISANTELTFFSKNGDILSRFSIFMTIFCLLNLIVSAFSQNFRLASGKRG